VAELLSMAERRLQDAQVTQLSLDLQHNIAYDGARLAVEALMAAEGYRSGHAEGHHAVVFEFLAAVDNGLFADRVERFNQARKLRNKTTYEQAGLVSDFTAAMIKKHAQTLLDDIRQWLAEHHPELTEPAGPGLKDADDTPHGGS